MKNEVGEISLGCKICLLAVLVAMVALESIAPSLSLDSFGSSARTHPKRYLAFLDRYLDFHPQDWRGFLARGVQYLWIHDTQAAIVDFDQCLAIKPDQVDAIRARAQANYVLCNFKGALLDCNRSVLVHSGQAQDFMQRGRVLCTLGQTDEGLSEIDKAIKKDTKLVDAYVARAFTYKFMGKLSQALADCNQALLINPESIQAIRCQAVIFMNQKSNQKAIDACNAILNKPLKLNFDEPDYEGFQEMRWLMDESYWIRGATYLQMGNFHQAVADATESIRYNPENTNPYIIRANAYYRLKEYSAALRDARRAIQIDPKLASSKYLAFCNHFPSDGNRQQALSDSHGKTSQ